MSVVNEPVEDGVADDVMPVVDGQLAGDEGCATSVSVLEKFE